MSVFEAKIGFLGLKHHFSYFFTPNDGGCDGGCNSCGGTQEPYEEPETNEPTTVEPTTVEPTTIEPTAAPTTPTREREPETTVTDIAEQTEELPEEIPDYSGSYSDENQVYPKPQIQVEELEREASSSCGRGDTDCELPAAVHNQGADQNECSGENCGEPVDVSADCLDCHVENKDIPGGSENAQFLQDLGCRGSNCDLANAYLENTTGEILMTTGGIPGTAAPTGPRTKTPRPSPPPTVRLKLLERPIYGFCVFFQKYPQKRSKGGGFSVIFLKRLNFIR